MRIRYVKSKSKVYPQTKDIASENDSTYLTIWNS